MMASLVLRNVQRHLPRLRPMIAALAAAIALLFLGNSISEAINRGYKEVYTEYITGHLTLSPVSERTFTVFGSEALLMGELLIPPVLVSHEELTRILHAMPGVEGTASLVTVAARVQIEGQAQNQPVFGVDFAQYAALFPRLRLLRGSLPDPGQPGILIHESRFPDREPEIGSPVLLSVYNNYSFTIREVPLAGIFSYPIADPVLDRVALIDANTARALNGYVYGVANQENQVEPAGGDLDDLFAEADTLAPATGSLDPLEIQNRLRAEDPAGALALKTREGAWNFILVRLAEGARHGGAGLIEGGLRNAGFAGLAEIQIRDWRHSAGGNAVLVWIVQILLNIGLIFIAVGASVVTVNALALSVLERTREIGTMRAIGASRGRVGLMISSETMVLVVGTGILGIAAGTGLVLLVNLLRIGLSNPVLQALFGSTRLTGCLSAMLIADHLLLSLALGLVSLVYPLRKSLRIVPVKAMAAV